MRVVLITALNISCGAVVFYSSRKKKTLTWRPHILHVHTRKKNPVKLTTSPTSAQEVNEVLFKVKVYIIWRFHQTVFLINNLLFFYYHFWLQRYGHSNTFTDVIFILILIVPNFTQLINSPVVAPAYSQVSGRTWIKWKTLTRRNAGDVTSLRFTCTTVKVQPCNKSHWHFLFDTRPQNEKRSTSHQKQMVRGSV